MFFVIITKHLIVFWVTILSILNIYVNNIGNRKLLVLSCCNSAMIPLGLYKHILQKSLKFLENGTYLCHWDMEKVD